MDGWSDQLQCFWSRIEWIEEHAIVIDSPQNSVTDMRGATGLAEAIDSDIDTVLARQDGKPDSLYVRENGKWKSLDVRTRQPIQLFAKREKQHG